MLFRKKQEMEICIVGWYFDLTLLNIMKLVKFPVTIVSHKKVDKKVYNGFDFVEIPNIGLEFGAYNHYLMNLWKGNNVLFMHDDISLNSIRVFKEIAALKHDVAYIFRDKAEEKANGGKHGRSIFCSSRFLSFVKDFTCDCEWCKEKEDRHNEGNTLPKIAPHKGFWFDPNNKGHVSGKPPIGVRHYNEAIYHFHWFLGRVRDQRCGPKDAWPCPEEKMDVVNRVYFPNFRAGRRGKYNHIKREGERYGKD